MNKNIFINFSNHPSSGWCKKQKDAVSDQYNAQIVDIAFPQINASLDEEEICSIATKFVEIICSYQPKVVMCQGEFGLTYQVITLLKSRGIQTVYSCSERKTIEQKTDSGTIKTSEFAFVRFRKY